MDASTEATSGLACRGGMTAACSKNAQNRGRGGMTAACSKNAQNRGITGGSEGSCGEFEVQAAPSPRTIWLFP